MVVSPAVGGRRADGRLVLRTFWILESRDSDLSANSGLLLRPLLFIVGKTLVKLIAALKPSAVHAAFASESPL